MRNRPSLLAETTSPHVEVTPAVLLKDEKLSHARLQRAFPIALGQARLCTVAGGSLTITGKAMGDRNHPYTPELCIQKSCNSPNN